MTSAKAAGGNAPKYKDTVYCVGCRRKGHVSSKCPCRYIQRYDGTESESENNGEDATINRKRYGGSRGSSDGRTKQ